MPSGVEDPLPSTVLNPTADLQSDYSSSSEADHDDVSDASSTLDPVPDDYPVAAFSLPLMCVATDGLADVLDSHPAVSSGHGDERHVSSLAPALHDKAIYDMHSTWLMELQSTWREYAQREFPDESRVIYDEIWYIHHQLRPRCDRSRTVSLDYLDQYWLDDIRGEWVDRTVVGDPLRLLYVRPTPPKADSQRCIAHLILVQGGLYICQTGDLSFSLPGSSKTIKPSLFRKLSLHQAGCLGVVRYLPFELNLSLLVDAG